MLYSSEPTNRTIVEMDEDIGYSFSTVFVYKNGNIIRKIKGISTLHFINKISRLQFPYGAPGNYSGYGKFVYYAKALETDTIMHV